MPVQEALCRYLPAASKKNCRDFSCVAAVGVCFTLVLLLTPNQTEIQKIAWTIYGMDALGLRSTKWHHQKMGDKYGIDIDVVQVNDYVESINQYTAGGFDGCAMTNMDALTIPAAGGVIRRH